jgi:G3E family GTPase
MEDPRNFLSWVAFEEHPVISSMILRVQTKFTAMIFFSFFALLGSQVSVFLFRVKCFFSSKKWDWLLLLKIWQQKLTATDLPAGGLAKCAS